MARKFATSIMFTLPTRVPTDYGTCSCSTRVGSCITCKFETSIMFMVETTRVPIACSTFTCPTWVCSCITQKHVTSPKFVDVQWNLPLVCFTHNLETCLMLVGESVWHFWGFTLVGSYINRKCLWTCQRGCAKEPILDWLYPQIWYYSRVSERAE